MNAMTAHFAKREGIIAKQLPENDEFVRQINAADVAELVDARDLKPFERPANPLECLTTAAKQAASEPAEIPANPAHLQNTTRLNVSFNKVSARGKRYVYLRGTDVAVVRGFTGSNAELDALLAGPEVAQIIAAHRGRQIAQMSGWRVDAAKALHKVTKARAARRGLAYALSEDGIALMLSSAEDCCTLTGLPFEYRPKKSSDWLRRPMAPSLDRISNTGGYEAGNVRVVCTCVNIAINEWGLENFEKMCRAFVERNRE